ncbi:MAG TPA: ribosomal subunit interface protein [Sutterella sp.]|nr:ribosomal subunit interface protein [Sutterella sp.]
MAQDLQVTFHGLRRSERIEAAIASKLEGLRKFNPKLGACRVAVTQEGHQVNGLFTVKVALEASGQDVVASKTDKDPKVAIGQVFDTLKRSVDDLADKVKGI